MGEEELFEVFGNFDPARYEHEAEERWGDSEAYQESVGRTKRYTMEDWKRLKDEGAENLTAMVALFDQGVEPSDTRAMDVAEEARVAIGRNFYPCSREMHVRLGEMYVADQRFAAHYDGQREGLAHWFCAAVRANASRATG